MSVLDLRIERPAAGGRMLARHGGKVVLVAGAIPGERVRARVERATKHVAWAHVVEIVEAAASRRTPGCDPACGGSAYAHIQPEHQRALKAEIVHDAFRRIGKMTLDAAVPVEPSPEDGYRCRARLHVQRGRAGFLLEGTHTLCDAGSTRQLHPAALPAVTGVLAHLGGAALACSSAIVAENVVATERVIHLEFDGAVGLGGDAPAKVLVEGVSGITIERQHGAMLLAGSPRISDTADTLFGSEPPVPPGTTWTRQAASFFQGNRFLVGALTRHVLDSAIGDRVADLYAGVGLFAVGMAARGARVVAVEGHAASADDLLLNARPWPDAMHVIRAAVEDGAADLSTGDFDAVVVDPPRTGLSAAALEATGRLAAPRLIYVSCDPATLARDAAKLVAFGYRLETVRAFDLFPNTAHVETVVSFLKGN